MKRKSIEKLKIYDSPVEGDSLSSLIADYLRSWGQIREATLNPAIPGVLCVCLHVCGGGLREHTREQNTGVTTSSS